MDEQRVKKIKEMYDRLHNKKTQWRGQYRLISKYLFMRNLEDTGEGGDFTTQNVDDCTAVEALEKSSAFITGAMWKQGGRSFAYAPHDKIPKTKRVIEYFAEISKITADILDHPRSNVFLSIRMLIKEWLAYGTAGLMCEQTDDKDSPIYLSMRDVKNMEIDDTEKGYVDTVMDKESMSVGDIVSQYGLEKITSKMRKDYIDGKLDAKYDILKVIIPRDYMAMDTTSTLNKRVATIHIDYETCEQLYESGYNEMPLFVARFSKNRGEMYGRSPAMSAMPDIITLNTLTRIYNYLIETQANPALGTYTESGDIDLSAGAVNVFDNMPSARSNEPPIFPIYVPKDPSGIMDRMQQAKEGISNAFMLDRLLDFNNQAKMTAYETSVRKEIQGVALGSMYLTLGIEIFNPLLTRVYNILEEKGYFGFIEGSPQHIKADEMGEDPLIIPEEVALRMERGEDVYTIDYQTPASRVIDAEQAQGILTFLEILTNVTPQAPTLPDKYNLDAMMETLARLLGVADDHFNGQDVTDEIRDARNEQDRQNNQMDQAGRASDINFKNTQSAVLNSRNTGDLNIGQ